MSVIFVYVTVESEAAARKIGRALVEDRLAACANILPGAQSIYHWQGKITETAETLLVLKSRSALFAALEARIREMHAYTNPCIVALPLAAASQDFLDWVLQETKP